MRVKYECGDKVLIRGTIGRIETSERETTYYMKEAHPIDSPVPGKMIAGKEKEFVPAVTEKNPKKAIAIQVAVSLFSGLAGSGLGFLIWTTLFSG